MSYRVEIKKSAGKALDDIPTYDRERILEALNGLKENPRPVGCKKLSGREGWRVRSQNYRIIYDIDDASKLFWFKLSDIVAMFIADRRNRNGNGSLLNNIVIVELSRYI